MEDRNDARLWSLGARAVALLSCTALSVALGCELRQSVVFSPEFFWANHLPEEGLGRLMLVLLAAAAAAGIGAVAWLVYRRRQDGASERAFWFARRVSPLGPLALLPTAFGWRCWLDHELVFLLWVLLLALWIGASVRASIAAGWSTMETRWLEGARTAFASAGGSHRLTPDRLALGVVVAAALGYSAWFGWHTAVWHLSVRSGYDLAIEDNILHNLLHGHFFKAAPTLGPTGSHFGRHSTLVSYLLLPFYALHPSAETVLVLQSMFLGLAAIPLFLFARRRIGSASAAVVAVAYLLHPAVHEGNLFEMHYLKLGLLPFWTALWLLDSGRTRLALVAAAVTLTVREDVATWVILLGVWGLFAGRSPRASAVTLVAGLAYVAVVKFMVMPRILGGRDDLLFMYRDLLPAGRSSFARVLATVVCNPVYTLTSLLDPQKLVYLLHILVPMALIPLQRPIGWWALSPGFLYCLLGTHYGPLVDIHYQYSTHLVAFLFPALALVLEQGGRAQATPAERRSRVAYRIAGLTALVAATLATSYQFGALLQQNTSRGGPVPYRFGWDDEGRERRRAIEALNGKIPADARIAASAFTVAQFSNRSNDYSLSLSLYDADWIVAPTVAREYVATELERTRGALTRDEFGVVAVEGPFFIARRGAPTAENGRVLARLSR